MVFVTTGLGTGGAEHMICKLVENCPSSAIEWMVVSLRDEGTFGQRLRDAGATVLCCNLQAPVKAFFGFSRVLRRIRGFSPDILQGWMYHGSLAASLISIFLPIKPKVFWSMRQTLYALDKETLTIRLIAKGLRSLSQRVEGVIYNSSLAMEQHRHIGICSRLDVVVPNGIDINKFKPEHVRRERYRAELGINESDRVLGLVARVHPMKDHVNFVRAAAIVVGQIPGVRLLLAGKGTEEVAIQDLLEGYGVADRAICLGLVQDPVDVYRALDVAVLSSAWGEAWPNVLGEAMACGVPCVATDVGDSRRILGECGTIVPAADPEALADACNALLSQGSRNLAVLGLASRNRIVSTFDIRIVVRQYLHLWFGFDFPVSG